MKLSELKSRLISEQTKGKWKIGNLKGVYKNFKDNESSDAKAWMKNRASEDEAAKLVWHDHGYWHEDPKISDREDRKQEREETAQRKAEEKAEKDAAKLRDKLHKDLYDRGMDAIGSSFPDGDPIDHISSFMRKNRLDSDDLDAAFKKHGDGYEKKGFYATVAGMWDDMQPDQIHDANLDLKAGRKPENTAFFDIKDGKVVAKKNPWK